MENKITLYPTNWLYNAGVVGFLRIIEFGRGSEYIAKMLERDERGLVVSPEDFKYGDTDFSLWYAQYCTKVFFSYIFDISSIGEVRKKIEKVKPEEEKQLAKTRLREISEKIKREISAVGATNSWCFFVAEINKLLDKFTDEMKSLPNVAVTKIDEDKKETKETLEYFSIVKNFLGYFYFNKGVINNPKGKDTKFLERFKQTYLEPALASFHLSNGNYSCSFCSRTFENFSNLTPFQEGDFSSIGVSSKTFKNFFYDGNEYSMLLKCPLCELILLCAFAGFSYKPWIYQTLEQTKWMFIHFPEVKTSWEINNKLKTILSEVPDRTFYISLLGSILEYFREKSYWVLGNILFTEISPVPSKQRKKPKFVYFNINRTFASLFSQGGTLISDLFKNLNRPFEIARNYQVNLATEVLKRLLHQEEIITLSFKYMKEIIKNTHPGEVYRAFALNCLDYLYREGVKIVKKGDNVTQEVIKQKFGILKGLQEEGAKAFSLEEIDEKKRKS
ncbi:MAG: Cas8a1 family CRISPR/Cas system-associated protein, partial [candidate division WOR-3 bacterium]